MEIKTILVTTDFSDTARKAYGPALTLARKFDARLVLTYVEEDKLPPLVVEYTAVGLDDIVRAQADRAAERLTQVAEEMRSSGVEVEAKVALGTPHVEIVQLAEECKADLVVMATHGRGFISHAILGSTTERVLRHAPCPVFVVRES